MNAASVPAIEDCLSFNPFEGDFGEQGDRTLSDSLVRARKQYQCSHCMGPVLKGEMHRSRRDVISGDVMSWRWCHACCVAMALQISGPDDDDDSARPYDDRQNLGSSSTGGGE